MCIVPDIFTMCPSISDNMTAGRLHRYYSIDRKLTALCAILDGDVAEEHFAVLGDDWEIEKRAQSALSVWGLEGLSSPAD